MDDQCLLLSGKSLKIIERLWVKVIDKCSEWANMNKLQCNKDKMQVVFCSANREIQEHVVKWGEVRIEPEGDPIRSLYTLH